MKKTGWLLALAYPDHFVSATESRYNTFLSWVGIVNNGMVRAGHSAVALIDARTGEVSYADFGRYITAFGDGRARTAVTDPDVAVDIKAEIGDNGECTNLEEILRYFDNNAELTHGEGKCYAGVYPVDIDAAWTYIRRINNMGSITYGPFTPGGNNCSRFTYNAILASHLNGWWFRVVMFFRFFPSIMPLDVVMTAPSRSRFLVTEDQLESVDLGQWDIWLRLWEAWKGEKLNFEKRELKPTPKGNWLTGIGDDGLFEIQEYGDDFLTISRKNRELKTIFIKSFDKPVEFNPESPYQFDYDCNAAYCTLLQGGRKYVTKVKPYVPAKTRVPSNQF